MLNIVTALNLEANPIIKYFNLKANGEIYQNDYINLIITGQGKIKSAINTALLLEKYKYPTLNIGICGSHVYEINEGFYIHKIIDTDNGYEYYPDFFKENSETLHTVSKVERYYTLVDMEASGFFEACYKFLNVNEIILYKIVSDTPEIKPDINLTSKLIHNHIEIIEKLLDEFLKKDEFFDEITETIKEAKLKMKLTKTQENQLKNILTFYKIKNIPFPTFKELKKKEEVKEFITSLFSSLET